MTIGPGDIDGPAQPGQGQSREGPSQLAPIRQTVVARGLTNTLDETIRQPCSLFGMSCVERSGDCLGRHSQATISLKIHAVRVQ